MDHPVRLIVTDDLRRSRLTVFFRLFLAIPHLFWVSFFGTVIALMVFVNWWILLFAGRPSTGIHDFVARFLRYATQVEAWLLLVVNPYPPFFLISDDNPYPIDLTVAPAARQSRWKTFFRLFLALPAFLLAGAFAGGSVAGGSYFRTGTLATASLFGWFVALFLGRMPRGLRDLGAWSIGYGAQVSAYMLLLTDRYPYTGPRVHVVREPVDARPIPEPPARLVVTDELRRSRLLVFFRLPLLAPHIVWSILWGALVAIVVLLTWFAALAIGRAPRPFARFVAAFVRYQTHLNAFAYLIGNPWPGFVGTPGSYPVDLELDPFRRQNRAVTFFRGLLALPAIVLSGAAGGVLSLVAILGWFVALILGRMPEGFRDAGAWAIGYTAQVFTYLFLLDGRYPFSGPPLTVERPEPPAEAAVAAAAA